MSKEQTDNESFRCPSCNQGMILDRVEREKRTLEAVIQSIGIVLFPTSATYLMKKTDYDRVPPEVFTPDEVLNMAMSSRYAMEREKAMIFEVAGALSPDVTTEKDIPWLRGVLWTLINK